VHEGVLMEGIHLYSTRAAHAMLVLFQIEGDLSMDEAFSSFEEDDLLFL